MNVIKPVKVYTASFKANPYPFYTYLRAYEPVYQTTTPDKQAVWLLSRYEDVQNLLKDPRFVKDRKNATSPDKPVKSTWVPSVFKPLSQNMLDQDAPNHTRLRALVHKVFTPRVVEQMRQRVESLSHELLDKAAQKGYIELVKDYALPLPVTIISEVLGVPINDREKFFHWSNVLIEMSAQGGVLRSIPTLIRFMNYLKGLCKIRETHPEDDLISQLIQVKENGDQLSEDELLAMIVILLIAGHETTVNLIGNGTFALLQHPSQLELLRHDSTLIKSTVEEIVRFAPPVDMTTERYAREDIVIADHYIPQGSLVVGILASANRDQNYFEHPDEFTITRNPNPHLSFGQSIHYCVGAPLGRLEGQIALHNLFDRYPKLRLAVPPTDLYRKPNMFLNGFKELPLAY